MKNNITPIPKVGISVADCEALRALAADPFQSDRARERAAALLAIAEGAAGPSSEAEEHKRSLMLARLKKHGLKAAIFGAPHRHPRDSRYDRHKLTSMLRRLLTQRPPTPLQSWNVIALTLRVRELSPEAHDISREWVRTVLRENLGIRSANMIEPYWLLQERASRRASSARKQPLKTAV